MCFLWQDVIGLAWQICFHLWTNTLPTLAVTFFLTTLQDMGLFCDNLKDVFCELLQNTLCSEFWEQAWCRFTGGNYRLDRHVSLQNGASGHKSQPIFIFEAALRCIVATVLLTLNRWLLLQHESHQWEIKKWPPLIKLSQERKEAAELKKGVKKFWLLPWICEQKYIL